jgi:uncharacterized protein (TIGR03437 family)
LFSAALSGAPILRLNTSSLRPIWVPQGTNGPTTVSFEAYNTGDGTLNPQVKGSHTWLTPNLGAARACSFDASKTCRPINVVLASSGLAAGAYSGVVSVTDSAAFDAPQNVRVTIYVGGNAPSKIDFFLPPDAGAIDAVTFQTPQGPAPTLRPSTQTGGNWLAVSSSGMGSFQFLFTHTVRATVQGGMSAGDFGGSVVVTNSAFAADNKTIPATLHVTTSPIARTAPLVALRIVQGAAAVEQPLAVVNGGRGTLTISGATASGGSWLTATLQPDGSVKLKADPTGLSPGFLNGSISITSNAANSPATVPVELEVQASSGPIVAFDLDHQRAAVVDAASFRAPVAGGALASLFGSQLATGTAQASTIPLPTTLADATVFVNDTPAPLIFVSTGQINFQMPFNLSGQTTIRVDRQGQRGNTMTVSVGARAAGIYTFPGTSYGIAVNASQGPGVVLAWPDIPAFAGIPKAPAKTGDVLVIYGSGFGPVDPPVATGTAAGASPVSSVIDMPKVVFGRGLFVPMADPLFIGLTPGLVGLYQLNVQVPPNVPTSNTVPVGLAFPDGSTSNIVEIAVQQ